MHKGRFQIVPASYLVFRRDNKVLMLRRANTGYRDGQYSLPSGHFEANESARACGVREAKEEVGVSISPKDLRFMHVISRKAIEGDHERVDFFFEVLKYSGTLQNCEPEKCDNLGWFALDNLPENTIPEVRQALAGLQDGIYYSELGF
jgi:ADP-ribose pyrophosphatase YjhB (NUDIX family)